MIIGQPNYLEQIDRLAIGLHGATTIQYLEGLPVERVMSINKTVEAVAEELKNGK